MDLRFGGFFSRLISLFLSWLFVGSAFLSGFFSSLDGGGSVVTWCLSLFGGTRLTWLVCFAFLPRCGSSFFTGKQFTFPLGQWRFFASGGSARVADHEAFGGSVSNNLGQLGNGANRDIVTCDRDSYLVSNCVGV